VKGKTVSRVTRAQVEANTPHRAGVRAPARRRREPRDVVTAVGLRRLARRGRVPARAQGHGHGLVQGVPAVRPAAGRPPAPPPLRRRRAHARRRRHAPVDRRPRRRLRQLPRRRDRGGDGPTRPRRRRRPAGRRGRVLRHVRAQPPLRRRRGRRDPPPAVTVGHHRVRPAPSRPQGGPAKEAEREADEAFDVEEQAWRRRERALAKSAAGDARGDDPKSGRRRFKANPGHRSPMAEAWAEMKRQERSAVVEM
jgi:hypothetical protein